MKRIEIKESYDNLSLTGYQTLMIAKGINEIMDYLEHLGRRNGKLFTCVNCRHATGFIGDLGKCCDKPLYEVSE